MASSPVLSSDSRRIIGSIFILGLVVVLGFVIICIKLCNINQHLQKMGRVVALSDQDLAWEEKGGRIKMLDKNSAWKTYSISDYSFAIPEEWTTQTSTTEDGMRIVTFFDGTTTSKAAELRCPLPQTGYEAWDFVSFRKLFTKNNISYEIGLNIGKSLDGELSNLNYITMERMQESDEENYEHSCQLMDWNGSLESTFKQIYESIEAK